MKNQELDQILQRAAVPERKDSYWERFPAQVMAQLRTRAGQSERALPAVASRSRSGGSGWGRLLATADRFRLRPAVALALVVGCIGLGFFLGVWKSRRSPAAEPQLAAIRKCYQELEQVFPQQIRAIVFDSKGVRFELAETADVPVSPPLFVRVWTPQGCEEFVTFSGQQIRINGQSCEVLLERNGAVLLVGEKSVWSSAEPQARGDGYRIEAQPLEKTS